MCGIFGIIRQDKRNIDIHAVQSMGGLLRHRGPDDTGIHLGPGVALGNNRLAIIDLDTGNQPIFNEDGNLLIVFNGEIYNHRELHVKLEKCGHRFQTQSDTETILHAFEEYGPKCVEHLNGMFAFAIWNIETRTLFFARDRLGIKPLYVCQTDGMFAFASEPKALLDLLPHPPRPDWPSISRFFNLGYFAIEDCAFEGIKKFPAGHYCWLKGGSEERTRYWTPSYGGGENISLDEAKRKLEVLAEEVIVKELESEVPVGVFLSGGLDSSLIALYTQRKTSEKLKSFSLGFEESTHDESAEARQVASHLGLEHHAFMMSRDSLKSTLEKVSLIMDEPFGDSTVLPLFILSNLARQQVKVVLTGWGGDELFAGYPTYKAHRMAETYRKLPSVLSKHLIPMLVGCLPVSDKYMSFEFKAKRFIKGMDKSPEEQHFAWMGYFDDATKDVLFCPEIRAKMKGGTLDTLANTILALPEKEIVDRIMHIDALTFLEGNGLFQADRISMANSLEARVPLLNNDMLDFVSALPSSLKMHGGELKAVLKETLRGHLPENILNMPKKGFGPPSSIWIRDVFKDTFKTLFSKSKVESQGVFDYMVIRRLLDEHWQRKADHGRILWLMLSFQLWFDRYIVNEKSV